MFGKFIEFLTKYHILDSFLYIILGFLLYEITKMIMNKNNKRISKKRAQTVRKLILNIVKYAIIVFVILSILKGIGMEITSILAGLGITGIVLGLALQDILKDIFVGISIILEDQFDIDDYVIINGFEGTVVDLTLKSTKIKNIKNEIKIISNRTITEITNCSKKNPNIIKDIQFPYEISIKKAEKILDNIVTKISEDIKFLKGDIKIMGLNKFKDSSIEYRVMIPVTIDKQFEVERIINKIIKEEFDKANISIPYNIIEVRNG